MTQVIEQPDALNLPRVEIPAQHFTAMPSIRWLDKDGRCCRGVLVRQPVYPGIRGIGYDVERREFSYFNNEGMYERDGKRDDGGRLIE